MTCIDDMTGPGGGGEVPRESKSKKTRDTVLADWIGYKGILTARHFAKKPGVIILKYKEGQLRFRGDTR